MRLGQAELHEEGAGGREPGSNRHIPPVVWPSPPSVPEDEMLGKLGGVSERGKQKNSPRRRKETHILVHRTQDFTMFCGNKGSSLLISLI